MKKVIAVLIALAMVLSMSVMSFAAFNGVKSPADILLENNIPENDYESVWNNAIALGPDQLLDMDNFWKFIAVHKAVKEQNIYASTDGYLLNWTEAWKAYTTYVASQLGTDASGAAQEIVAIVQGGYVPVGDVISIVGQAIMGGIGGDGNEGDLSGIISDLIDKITNGGNAEGQVTSEAYVDELVELLKANTSFEDITKKIGEDLASGKIVVKQIPEITSGLRAKIEAGELDDNETVQKIVTFLEGLGNALPDIKDPSLPDITLPSVSLPDFSDITLPGGDDNSALGGFVDVILGIIGTISDIFNPDKDDDPPSGGDDDPPFDDGDGDNFGDVDGNDPGDDDGTTDPIPDTGDVSFVAVAAVAAVAGVAFVLTRKKSDAE